MSETTFTSSWSTVSSVIDGALDEVGIVARFEQYLLRGQVTDPRSLSLIAQHLDRGSPCDLLVKKCAGRMLGDDAKLWGELAKSAREGSLTCEYAEEKACLLRNRLQMSS